ncbi:MAG: glutathione synthase [Proteobacteria bacterium]|jgi:glutathione synthase|nr:glutathione synthase [Pseudomonadota bacterium]MBT5794651.1 glutathione synthase [Deltaproteobacteria bacterium]MDB3917785.1 glutathione synthase [bacterium]
MQTQVQNESIEIAIEMAKLYGMLNYLPDGQLSHAPFSLSPYSISAADLQEMTELTSYFSELMIRISQDWEFLAQYLSPISKTDPFLKMLLDLRGHEVTQSKQLLVQRNDFFLVKDELSNSLQGSSSALRQVELNTVSASFPFLITQLARLHQTLSEQNKLEQIIPNNPLIPVVDAFAKAVQDYGLTDSVMMLVSQPAESNRFDQLGLEQLLWEKYKIQTLRKTLTEIYESGSLREGHLIIAGKKVALTYYRAGYTPDDFRTGEAQKGRQLIEASSTIQVPNLPMQLAGMKKIQQVLTRPEILSTFVTDAISKRFLNTFAAMHALDDIIETPNGELSASEWASRNPEKYVLKPQREGGGNNYFGRDITKKMAEMQPEEKDAYVLMEKIEAETHPAILVVNGYAETLTSVSEIGRYGICFAENGVVESNEDIGYLVRTKAENVNEGGVCAGFACLNSLTKA